jgi:Host cell surface-exposed lipoprotein
MWTRYLVMATTILLVSGCDGGASAPTDKALVAPEATSGLETQSAPSATPGKVEAPKEEMDRVSLTASQVNAVRSAEQYLEMSGFSRKGLIHQLSSDAGDGYAVADATAAVDSLTVDWNDNAAKSARQYLESSGFSCKGLIEQLSSSAGDEYTKDQATYGARQAGAC